MTKIINWKTGKTIIEDENLSTQDLVEKAVKEGISLQYADLFKVDLTDTDLRGSDLKFANLAVSKLIGVDLRGVNLDGVNLCGADLFTAKINQDQLIDLIEAQGLEIINNK